ncbi:hypothetical protein BO70DRAFT_146652 [Aspergillus heteromorphus CBS 117.55]|uniref:Uncharacterized protein n=1 Tax=Aspergillus heteromorphus CBS 117.55 TaxID=1448321 RepID=A0A317VA80_9EURO|nr:uncharacterized protein BO70DRAFT_146652 [Aspergillus heteromorphus CBS 117.55]PWY69802.1 hypothetical protein BO70DRAFT_146652 [Aspergillus heteromorphus CBS 117.55]
MSHVSISKSYAVLAGIEGYTRAKRKVRTMQEKVDGVIHKFHWARQEHAENRQRGETDINKGKTDEPTSQNPTLDDHWDRGAPSLDLPYRTKPGAGPRGSQSTGEVGQQSSSSVPEDHTI